jgi:CBS domain containing-hemolysin-like protein
MDLALAPIGVALVLLIANALGIIEMAVTRTTRVKAHRFVDQKRKGAERLLQIVEDPAPVLNVTMMLRVVCFVAATVWATAFALEHLSNWALAIAVAVMVVLLFVVAELLPKTVAVQKLDGLALAFARPAYWASKLLDPVARLFVLATNALMVLLPGRGLPKGPYASYEEGIDESDDEEEEIEEEERELIHSVFEFGDTIVREVMVPRTDMVAIKSDATLQESLDTIIKAGYSRIPIYEGDTDNIIGVLYAKDVLKRIHESKGEAKVAALGRAPLFVPEQKKVAELLREMQNQRVHMAIVVDEYGGTAGLATIEDVIEEIVGEIVDEYDQEEPLVEPVDDDTIRVDAKMPIDEINELFNVTLPDDEWDTVGGLVFGLTGRLPLPGEVVRLDSLEFQTERVIGRRIKKVVIKRLVVAPEGEES